LIVARTLGTVVKRWVPQLSDAAVSTYAGSALLLTAVGIVATAIPTWRASRVSPAQVLRGD
jgi:ABC-type lipoprotein release transport system permease subunit